MSYHPAYATRAQIEQAVRADLLADAAIAAIRRTRAALAGAHDIIASLQFPLGYPGGYDPVDILALLRDMMPPPGFEAELCSLARERVEDAEAA